MKLLDKDKSSWHLMETGGNKLVLIQILDTIQYCACTVNKYDTLLLRKAASWLSTATFLRAINPLNPELNPIC
jgi:hypothetical protein